MKKIFLSSVVAATLAVSVQADSSKFYIGVGNNMLSGTYTAPYSFDYGSYAEGLGYSDFTAQDSGDVDVDGITIKFGYKLDASRVELSYSSLSAEGNIYDNGFSSTYKHNEDYKGFDIDWVKPFGDNAFKPYISLGFGYHNWTDYATSASTNTKEDRGGTSYNLGAGILYSLGVLELDLAYKFKLYNWDDATHVGTYSSYTFIDAETEVSGLYAGINYHF